MITHTHSLSASKTELLSIMFSIILIQYKVAGCEVTYNGRIVWGDSGCSPFTFVQVHFDGKSGRTKSVGMTLGSSLRILNGHNGAFPFENGSVDIFYFVLPKMKMNHQWFFLSATKSHGFQKRRNTIFEINFVLRTNKQRGLWKLHAKTNQLVLNPL